MIIKNQRAIPFPLSHASYFGKRMTATFTCCLQPCGRVINHLYIPILIVCCQHAAHSFIPESLF